MHEWKLIAASLHRSSYQAFPGHGSARIALFISFCKKASPGSPHHIGWPAPWTIPGIVHLAKNEGLMGRARCAIDLARNLLEQGCPMASKAGPESRYQSLRVARKLS